MCKYSILWVELRQSFTLTLGIILVLDVFMSGWYHSLKTCGQRLES